MTNKNYLWFLIAFYLVCTAQTCQEVKPGDTTCYGVDFFWVKDQRTITQENGQRMVTLESSLWLLVEANISQEATFTITGAELMSYYQNLPTQLDMAAQTIRVQYPGVQTTNRKSLLLGDMVVKYPYSSDDSLLPKMSVVYTANALGNFDGCTFDSKPPVQSMADYRNNTDFFALTQADL